MVLICGESGRNLDDGVNLYAQRFPGRKEVFNLKKDPSSKVTGENNKIAVAHNPHVSTQEIAHGSGLSQSSVLKILNILIMCLHQDLHGDDFQNRVAFCQWAREQI
ncbi:hypothetical protein ILUMI_09213 [Ignelater luminosus]|uniref:Uncharacterized protein n=1 Tax=Ignelater luminosus TaxID=2038154 RepID=A0A8K0D670_IGNLU|nr:hypothetical protein ILUMI_09211 [Ignelater luminosus]KAF2896964.1 hypothetical protein ILUMI_09213 [Ignelater luminosus]